MILPSISGNILELPDTMPSSGKELFEALASGTDVHVERIVSAGGSNPDSDWYDQNQDEWVVLLQGNAILQYENGFEQPMKLGDFVFIPAHCKHRVSFTSTEPPCIWLAIHGNLES